jgi:hypothetical protein
MERASLRGRIADDHDQRLIMIYYKMEWRELSDERLGTLMQKISALHETQRREKEKEKQNDKPD